MKPLLCLVCLALLGCGDTTPTMPAEAACQRVTDSLTQEIAERDVVIEVLKDMLYHGGR